MPGETTDLTYPPWHQRPDVVTLHGPGLTIYGRVPRHRRGPDIQEVDQYASITALPPIFRRQHPTTIFCSQLYPAPRGPVYRRYLVDTRWTVKIKKGPLHGRLFTVVALVALNELWKLLGRYGPSAVHWAIKDGASISLWAWGRVIIENLEVPSLNQSSSDKGGGFQTFCGLSSIVPHKTLPGKHTRNCFKLFE